ncbi:hypothetical protein AMECASPLE_022507 [Ameca splendens]|uniref:Uncharacterized protein n=1 Tax=Ameca splendens TaxID=208324 RepID=A0ABV0YQR3_9TELE
MAEFLTQTKPNIIKQKLLRLFHFKLLLSAQNTTSYVNRAEEKLSGAMNMKKTSTGNKGLSAADLRSCGGGSLFCRPAKLHVTAVTTVILLSFLQTGKTAPLCVVEA